MNFEEWEATPEGQKCMDVAPMSSRLAFAAGAASRDAEIARLKTVPMRYRRMAFNAQLQDEVTRLEQENDELLAQIKQKDADNAKLVAAEHEELETLSQFVKELQ